MSSLYTHALVFVQLYLAAGVLTLLISASSPLRAWLRRRRDPESLMFLMETMDPQSKTLWYRVRERVLAPVLTALGMILLWPGVPWMRFRQWQRDREMARWQEAQIFKVQRPHLLERLSLPEIEAREVVQDPLDAVPPQPFGHLNAAWCELKGHFRPGDELWSFSAQWHDKWGRPDWRTGYVLWRRAKPVGHILTMLKPLEEPSVSQTSSGSSGGKADPGMDEIEIPEFLRRQAD